MNLFNNKKALLSTLSHPQHHQPALSAAAVTSSTWFAAAGFGLAAVSILFAPEHEFDNLDCQSYCQRVVDGKEKPPTYHFL